MDGENTDRLFCPLCTKASSNLPQHLRGRQHNVFDSTRVGELVFLAESGNRGGFDIKEEGKGMESNDWARDRAIKELETANMELKGKLERSEGQLADAQNTESVDFDRFVAHCQTCNGVHGQQLNDYNKQVATDVLERLPDEFYREQAEQRGLIPDEIQVTLPVG